MMDMYTCTGQLTALGACDRVAGSRTRSHADSRTRTAMTSTSAAIAAASVAPCGSPKATDTAAKFTLPPTYDAHKAAATCAGS